MQKLKLNHLVLAGLLVLGASQASAVEVYNSIVGGYTADGPNSGFISNTGDVWTFYCPTGGDFSLFVDTASAEAYFLDANTVNESGIDPGFIVLDGAGNTVATDDDGDACTFAPANSFTCPKVTNQDCGEGARHSILISNQGYLPGGTYKIELTVRDANDDPIVDSKIKLGGGPKPKLPKVLNPSKLAVSPLVNDSQLLFPTPP